MAKECNDTIKLTGPTPYSKGSSAKAAGTKAHAGTAGRGGAGKFGSSEQNKGMVSDIGHPDSHAAFERLGVK